jgi:histidyl-tRNA synthetase
MGDVVLTELLRGRGLLRDATPALDYWVAGDDASLTGALMTLAHDLRERGRSVEYALRPQTLARQLKAASAAGARRVVILRRDRLADGVVTVRDLADGAEETVSVGAWLPRA